MYVPDIVFLRDLHADETEGPILLGCEGDVGDVDLGFKELPPHRDEDQVELDVRRSFVYYPEGLCHRSLRLWRAHNGADSR